MAESIRACPHCPHPTLEHDVDGCPSCHCGLPLDGILDPGGWVDQEPPPGLAELAAASRVRVARVRAGSGLPALPDGAVEVRRGPDDDPDVIVPSLIIPPSRTCVTPKETP